MNTPLPKLHTILHALYGGCDGLIECRALPSMARVFVALATLKPLGAFLDAHAHEDLYWGVATRRDDTSGALENCLHLPALFVDVDFKTTPEDEARQRLVAFPFPPSMVVQSGGGLHVYFALREPLNLQIPDECAQAKSLLRRLATAFASDLAAAEPARILRVPGSFNRKPDYPAPRRVTVDAFATCPINPCDVDALLPSEPVVSVRATQFTLPLRIRDGERNTTLFRLSRSLVKKGLSREAILAAVLTENRLRCDPPLSDREVEQIVAHALAMPDRPRPPRHEARDETASTTSEATASEPESAPADSSTNTPSDGAADSTAALLTDTAAYARRYVVMTDHQATAVALWAAHTHTFLAAECTPYLHITAATKRAGKTLLLEVLEPVVSNPWLTARTSAAALPRKIDLKKPTLLLDESDQALTENSDYSKALTGVLNSGYRKSGTTSLCVGEGAGLKVVDLATFCCKAVAGIGRLPDTVADRCIVIKLRRRTREETVERARARAIHGVAKPLRQRLQAWAPGATRALLHAAPDLPDALDDRAQDVWEPLLAVAELAGGEWPARARVAAVALSGSRQDDDAATLLLADIHDVMDTAVVKDERGPAHDVISSKSLLQALNRLDERPWPTWSKGHEMTANALARLLAAFDLRSDQYRVAGRIVRGLRREALEALFLRYLGIESLRRDKPNEYGPDPQKQAVTDDAPVTTEKRENPNNDGVCHGVTTQTPGEARGTS